MGWIFVTGKQAGMTIYGRIAQVIENQTIIIALNMANGLVTFGRHRI
jgi:hypothetical protein